MCPWGLIKFSIDLVWNLQDQLTNLDQILYVSSDISRMGERLLLGFGADSVKTVIAMAMETSQCQLEKPCLHAVTFSFDLIFVKLAGNQDWHKISDEFEFWLYQVTDFGVMRPWASEKIPIY